MLEEQERILASIKADIANEEAQTEEKPKRTRTRAPKKAAEDTKEETQKKAEAKPKTTRRTSKKKTEEVEVNKGTDSVEAPVSSREAEVKESTTTKEAASQAKPSRTRRRKTTPKAEEVPTTNVTGEALDNALKPEGAKEPEVSEAAKEESQDKEKSQSVSEQNVTKEDSDSSKGSDSSELEEPKEEKETKEEKDSRESKDSKSKSQKRQKTERARREEKHSKDRERRRNRRTHSNNRREPVVPQTSREDLEALKVVELRQKANELGIEHKGLLKAQLVEAVFEASIKAEGFVETEGILDILTDGYGFLRTSSYLPSETDVYVSQTLIRRNHLRKGDKITGQVRPPRSNEKYAALQEVATVNEVPIDQLEHRVRFADLTPVFPDERLVLEHGKQSITARVIDLCAPIGKGQRGLIVSPPKAGKTTILKNIAAAISANNPEVHLMCLLVDERPEEVTDMERSIKGEVISSTFDMPSENHIACAEMVIERAKRLVEKGEDVVILLDSLTRLARAYNLAQPASGRILSGGVDSTALYPPKKFLGAARNIEGGGSLTILASALIETGSKMDEVIFEEFKGTGNMEVKLDRSLADRRIFPAIDPISSGTRREDLLLDPQEAPLIWGVRRILANQNNTERAMNTLIKALKQTNNNSEFLLRTAKKAQGRQLEENLEL